MIPLVDIKPNEKLSKLILSEINKVVKSGNYILGKRLESFEKKFAEFAGARYAAGVASGTDALRLSLRALGIGEGDKVLTVALTSPFTIIAILEERAIPILCDVDEKTWTIDIKDAEKKFDKKVKAIIPVHLFGNPCDMDSVLSFAMKNRLKVIEDACQAHGASYKAKNIGTFGNAAGFSFYPTKNLGAMGDAGIVTTNDSLIAKKLKILRNGGQTKRFWHEYSGINSRLDEMQAAILEVKLAYLLENNLKRAKLVNRYKKELNDIPINFQDVLPRAVSSNHLFVIGTNSRDKLKHFLSSKNIICDVYYPYPVDALPAFSKFANGNLAVTKKLTKELLALPLYPQMTVREQNMVIESIKRFFGN